MLAALQNAVFYNPPKGSWETVRLGYCKKAFPPEREADERDSESESMKMHSLLMIGCHSLLSPPPFKIRFPTG